MPIRPPAHEIMVVDDDEGLRLLVADALRAEGYAVAGADSGSAAVAALRERRPDLMLLDLQLEDMAGIALLDRLRRENLAVPFVVITGQGNVKVAVEMMKHGALDYLMKDTGILELVPSVVKRALAAMERERSLAAAQAEQRRLEKEVQDVSEKERQRFGADLHDGVGQQLTAIELMCVGLKKDVAALDPKLAKQVEKIAGMLRDTVAQTRALARGLSPLDEQPDALQNGLADLAEHANSLGRLRCRVEFVSAASPVDRTAASHLFRIAQEAVNNAVKHSGATEVTLRWEEKGGAYRLEISDNGKGLPSDPPRGMGVGVMNYRAAIIGAELRVESRPGGGVTVVCILPRKP
ncbi:MAG: response regulator [Opitutaceae bacterium]|jgi:signal transduction histidine kinase